ncbi:uncharacterized protein LOC135216332 [Macrobrachium nipponense]|uniref:uncharacterized protein LOC135216332 n=1 Tax=Macrobrachium nipponense TaxID=159736 RepID=UPI0030C7A1A4
MGNSDSRCKTCKNCPDSHTEASEECTCSCQVRVTCTCKCNVGNGHDIAQKVSAIAGGTIAGAAGIAVTVFTGGIALPIVGGMVAGAGMSSLIHGSVKAVKREKICGKDFGVDVGVGFATGVIGGGGVAATESLASVAVSNVAKEAFKRGAVKLGVRTAGGIVSSVASKAVHEVGDCVKGNKEWSEYGNDPKTWGNAIAFGALGGVGAHASSNISKLGSTAQNATTQIVKRNANQSKQSSNSLDINSSLRSTEKQQEYMRELAKASLTKSKIILDKVNEENEDLYEGNRKHPHWQ